jgi:hypothetical protein
MTPSKIQNRIGTKLYFRSDQNIYMEFGIIVTFMKTKTALFDLLQTVPESKASALTKARFHGIYFSILP